MIEQFVAATFSRVVSVKQVGGQTANTIVNHWPGQFLSIPHDEAKTTTDALRVMFCELTDAVDENRPLSNVLSKARRIAIHLSQPYWIQLFTMHLEGRFFLFETMPDPNDEESLFKFNAELDATWDRAAGPIANPRKDRERFLKQSMEISFCSLRPSDLKVEIESLRVNTTNQIIVVQTMAMLRQVETRIWIRINEFLAQTQKHLTKS